MSRILVTGAGSEIAVSVLQALDGLGHECFGADVSPFSSGLFLCGGGHLIPPAASDEYLPSLREVIAAEGIELVMAGTDTELGKLAELKESGLCPETEFCVGSREVIRVCRDKGLTARFFRAKGLPFAETVTREGLGGLVKEHGYPVVAKPAGGSGSQEARLIHSAEELGALGKCDGLVFQRHLRAAHEAAPKAGEPLRQRNEVSAQVLVGRDREIIGAFQTLNELKAGMPVRVEPMRDERVEDAVRAMAGALVAAGLVGPCNFQLKLTDRGPEVFEVNPRFTGITSTRAMLGFNECQLSVESFLHGRPSAELAAGLRINRELVVCRHHTNVAMSRQDYQRLADKGSLRARGD